MGIWEAKHLSFLSGFEGIIVNLLIFSQIIKKMMKSVMFCDRINAKVEKAFPKEGVYLVAIQLKKGEHLVRKGETTKAIYIVLRGSVRLQTVYNQITMGTGSVIGFMMGISDEYICDYVAAEDSLIASYKYESPEDYKTIFKEQPKYCYAFLCAAIKQYRIIYDVYKGLEDSAKKIADFIAKQYSDYEIHCVQSNFDMKDVKIGEYTEVFEPEPICSWEKGYFRELVDMPEKNLRYILGDKEDLTIGVILQIAEIMSRMIANMDALKQYMQSVKDKLLCEDEDLLELWFDLAMKNAQIGEDYSNVDRCVTELEGFLRETGFYEESVIEMRLQYYKSMDFREYVQNHRSKVEHCENENGEIAEILTREQILKTDFVAYIMKYAGYEQADIDTCKTLLEEYDEIAGIYNHTPDMQKTRRALTNIFYDIYEKAFLRAVQARTIPAIMKLFFNFGVLDLKMAGEKNLDALMAISELLDNQWVDQKQWDEANDSFCHVYSAYQWLCLIYRGEKEPSKNEFDIDYAAYILEMRKSQEITREQENELKHDQLKKVEFELHNMFMTNNRITYGRITAFCPVLHRKDFVRSIDQLIVSSMTINAAVDAIRDLDYSCFFREVFFASPKYGIERTEIMKEVLPDVILMPNIGSKAMMWQESAGVKKDTPARFIFPIMTANELPDMMLETIGRYRWEICRKILGVRWNDIREKSLTSEFNDYVQFYRKNRNLSQQAKERVKAELVHAKNNYREVFVMDYVNWMKHESQGNFRLNKVSRRIISEYVPFKAEIRKKLEVNPIFKEAFVKSDIVRERKREKEKILFDRYVAAGGAITPEIEAHLKFYGISYK